MVGRQTPFLALLVPLILSPWSTGAAASARPGRSPSSAVCAFAIGQFACSNYLSVELTDIVASLLGAGAIVALLRVWQPGEHRSRADGRRPQPAMAGGETEVDQSRFSTEATRRADVDADGNPIRDSSRDVLVAYAPYLIIIVVFALAQITWLPFKDCLDGRTKEFAWPGLHVVNGKGEAPKAAHVQVQLRQRGRHAAAALRPADDAGPAHRDRARAAHLRRVAGPAEVGDLHGRVGARARLRHEPLGPDDHDRPVAGRRRRLLRVPVADPRLARRGGDRLGHVVELAVRRPAGVGRAEGRPRSRS